MDTLYSRNSGLRNHTWLMALPNAPFWFWFTSDLNALGATTDLGPAQLLTQECAGYAPIGIRLYHRTAVNGNLMHVRVAFLGLDAFGKRIEETIELRGDSRVYSKGNVAFTGQSFARLDRVRITKLAASANDQLQIGYPLPIPQPIPATPGAVTTYLGQPGLGVGHVLQCPHIEPEYTVEPEAYAALVLDTAGTDTLRVAAGDRLVVTDEQSIVRWDFVAGAAVGDQISLGGITTADGLRDRIITTINAAADAGRLGGIFAIHDSDDGGAGYGSVRLRYGTDRTFIELFRWNAGNPQIIKNGGAIGVDWYPVREVCFDPGGWDLLAPQGPINLNGDQIELLELSAADRFQLRTGATAVPAGFTAVTIGTTGGIENAESAAALRTAINTLGAPNTTWKAVLNDGTGQIGFSVRMVNAPGYAQLRENSGSTRMSTTTFGGGYVGRIEGLRSHAQFIDFSGFCARAATGAFDATGALASEQLLGFFAWDILRFREEPASGTDFSTWANRPSLGGPRAAIANNAFPAYPNLVLLGTAMTCFLQTLQMPNELHRGHYGLHEVRLGSREQSGKASSQRPGYRRPNTAPNAVGHLRRGATRRDIEGRPQ